MDRANGYFQSMFACASFDGRANGAGGRATQSQETGHSPHSSQASPRSGRAFLPRKRESVARRCNSTRIHRSPRLGIRLTFSVPSVRRKSNGIATVLNRAVECSGNTHVDSKLLQLVEVRKGHFRQPGKHIWMDLIARDDTEVVAYTAYSVYSNIFLVHVIRHNQVRAVFKGKHDANLSRQFGRAPPGIPRRALQHANRRYSLVDYVADRRLAIAGIGRVDGSQLGILRITIRRIRSGLTSESISTSRSVVAAWMATM